MKRQWFFWKYWIPIIMKRKLMEVYWSNSHFIKTGVQKIWRKFILIRKILRKRQNTFICLIKNISILTSVEMNCVPINIRFQILCKTFYRAKQTRKSNNGITPLSFYDGYTSNSEALIVLEESLKLKYSRDEIPKLLKSAINTLTVKNDDSAKIIFLGKNIKINDAQLYDFSGSDVAQNLELKGEEKFKKILSSHLLFSKYSE